MERLRQAGVETPQRGYDTAPGDLYVAPGEWRGDAEALRPSVSKVVKTKVKRFRLRLAVYGAIVAAVVIWLVLSFTVWGNPSAAKRSMQLIDAVNARNSEAFVGLFEEKHRPAAEVLYNDLTSYLGANGEYEGVKLDVEVASVYDAASYLESGTIARGGGSSVSISGSDNLVIILENHNGRWYVVPSGTDLIP